MRDRLIELLRQRSCYYVDCKGRSWAGCQNVFIQDSDIESIADHLLANGVIVPPCKVGDTVYAVSLNTETNAVAVHRGYIGSIDIRSAGNYLFICHEGFDDEPYFKNICCKFENFGKTVFLTREEAEQALKEKE